MIAKLPKIGDAYYFAHDVESFSDIIIVREFFLCAGDRSSGLMTIAFMQPMDFNMLAAAAAKKPYKKNWKWTYTNLNCCYREDEFKKLIKNGILIHLKL